MRPGLLMVTDGGVGNNILFGASPVSQQYNNYHCIYRNEVQEDFSSGKDRLVCTKNSDLHVELLHFEFVCGMQMEWKVLRICGRVAL